MTLGLQGVNPLGAQCFYGLERLEGTEMVRDIEPNRNIACVESLWNRNIENRLSVAPVLEISSRINLSKFIHLSCNTVDELVYHLNLLKKRRGYGILYLSFHGRPGMIVLDGTGINIEDVGYFMGKGFRNWIIHFGCCETMRIGEKRKIDFLKQTRALMVTGYKTDVDWINSAIMDLLLLTFLLPRKNIKRNWMIFKLLYRDLISFTGLEVFHKKLLKLGK
jgi:hypothetical protein